VDADAAAQWRLDASIAPRVGELADALRIASAIATQARASSLTPRLP